MHHEYNNTEPDVKENFEESKTRQDFRSVKNLKNSVDPPPIEYNRNIEIDNRTDRYTKNNREDYLYKRNSYDINEENNIDNDRGDIRKKK